MRTIRTSIEILEHVPISTWFGVGGCADAMATPTSLDELRACRDIDDKLVVLGEGANLLVCDEGIDRLVVRLSSPAFTQCAFHDNGIVSVGSGVTLPKLINLCERRGLAGIEGLAGFPASIGGAIRMNAGGAFGEIGDAVHSVTLVCKDNTLRTLHKDDIAFSYRETRFGNDAIFDDAVVMEVQLKLTPDDPNYIKQRKLDAMEYKKRTQPLSADSAGCCFKNPTLPHDIDSIGSKGLRVSAGMLIDRACLKGTEIRSARVSEHHANFICSSKDGCARDIIELMDLCQRAVHETFGVLLQREVVVWERSA
ncbi:MAG: UDP-N-acetylmuramate dehydrogenase [Phycisphaeraceae bacterium]|nr:UDP-N-acetylmuramate dehydrogenase [Phycisphaerales bacterium]MCB9861625.1 UDP-N-acetylmuramate dehydrogenase [Phycisphaeraceae bacterium]